MQIVDFQNQISPIQGTVQVSGSFPNWGYAIWQSVYMSDKMIREVVLTKRLAMNRRINKSLKGDD